MAGPNSFKGLAKSCFSLKNYCVLTLVTGYRLVVNFFREDLQCFPE